MHGEGQALVMAVEVVLREAEPTGRLGYINQGVAVCALALSIRRKRAQDTDPERSLELLETPEKNGGVMGRDLRHGPRKVGHELIQKGLVFARLHVNLVDFSSPPIHSRLRSRGEDPSPPPFIRSLSAVPTSSPSTSGRSAVPRPRQKRSANAPTLSTASIGHFGVPGGSDFGATLATCPGGGSSLSNARRALCKPLM